VQIFVIFLVSGVNKYDLEHDGNLFPVICFSYRLLSNWRVAVNRSTASLALASFIPLEEYHLPISCSSKSRLLLPSWYRLTPVGPDKIQAGCVCIGLLQLRVRIKWN